MENPENYVENGGADRKRRKKNTESIGNERKRLRLSGKRYTNYKGALVPEKKPPKQNVVS